MKSLVSMSTTSPLFNAQDTERSNTESTSSCSSILWPNVSIVRSKDGNGSDTSNAPDELILCPKRAGRFRNQRFLCLFACTVVGFVVLFGVVLALFIILYQMDEAIAGFVQDPEMCLPCNELYNDVIGGNDPKFNLLTRNGENCCAQTPKQKAIIFNMFYERKTQEASRGATCVGNCDLRSDDENYSKHNTTTRVSAHYVYEHLPRRTGKGVITGWRSKHEKSFEHGIFLDQSVGYVSISYSGLYYIYSQVSFVILIPDTNHTEILEHALYKYNKDLPNHGQERLAYSVRTECWDPNRKFTHSTSNTGVVVYLSFGDKIFVNVSHLGAILNERDLSFFGMFKL